MTDDDMKTVAEWQSSPPGRLFDAIHTTDNGLKEMEVHMRTRQGIHEMRKYREDLVELMERIQTIVYAATPRTEAAE